MKAWRVTLCAAFVLVIMTVTALAGAVWTFDKPSISEARKERTVVVDHGIDGDPNSTQIYIQPYQIGPGKYVYVYADEYSWVFSYRDDTKQPSRNYP